MYENVKELYSRLQAIGISKSFIEKVLPDWWDDEITKAASGMQQLEMRLAQAFNLKLDTLESPSERVLFRNSPESCKFKLTEGVTKQDVLVAANYATAVAKRLLYGFSDYEQTQVPPSPSELRRAILASNSRIDLISLLDWCRTANIPVVHISSLPGKKMIGLAMREREKYAIVLCKKGTPSHLLFHLAHEIGHIACGHLVSNGFMADAGESIEEDVEEREANDYAQTLLNGTESPCPPCMQEKKFNPTGLLNYARKVAQDRRVDVGHIILNYAKATDKHSEAAQALKLMGGESKGPGVVNAFYGSDTFYSLDAFSEDERIILERIVA